MNIWKIKTKKNNPNPLRQIASDKFIIDDKHLIEELAKKMKNPYYSQTEQYRLDLLLT